MFDKKQIEKNINWLLTNGSPPVAYLTHRDLLDTDPGSREMKDLWEKVKNQDEVSHIFSRQQTDGSWCTSGPWAAPASYLPQSGYTPVSPKYVTTAWILPILGDMGLTVEDIRIRRACDYILSYQDKSGFIGEEHRVTKYDPRTQNPCRFSVMLIALGKVGAVIDPRVKKACDFLVKWQRDDGGWAFSEHYIQRRWTRSCPWSTYHATLALYSTDKKTYHEEISRALRFLIWHLSIKKKEEITRFFYHGHSTVHELLMLSELNIGMQDKAVQAILEWLSAMYLPDEDHYRYRGKPISRFKRGDDAMDARVARYRLFHLIEDDWLTYYLTRIACNIRNMDYGTRGSR